MEVTFDIDANGIVHVSAKDKATGKEQQIRIQASGGLSDNDIDQMVKDAEQHAEEDKKRKELVEARNHAEAAIHSSEKNLEEFADKIPDGDRDAIKSAIDDLRAVKDGEDAAAIQAKVEALQQAAMKLGEAMYKAQQEAGGTGGPEEGPSDPSAGAGDGGDSTVVDADFEEVDPNKDK